MNHLETELLVIGGGATGAGIAWDAALRGFSVALVEKRDLTHGTTGRYHGLLHSGGRYVVKDPQSAAECIAENSILRRTHTHCIEDTSGFFVVTPEDEGDYPDQFKAACQRIGIPCAEISVSEARRREPLLNPRISRVFEVPDGSADSFLATHVTAQAAQLAGARILIYHEVISLIVEGDKTLEVSETSRVSPRRVVGARVRDVANGSDVEIRAAMTINASGAWAGQIAQMAGIAVNVIPGKGTLLAMNHRIVNTVVNRCKAPGDGDIIVPIHTVAVIGTTDERVSDPENLTIEPWEVQLLLDEGEKLIPGLSQARVVRAWAGVRPLYQEGYAGASREATRAFTLLDHESRDGVSGFLTILGGKWTTFRLMAEKTLDTACEQLGARKPCVTASTPVPGVEQGHYWLGHRLREVEENRLHSELVCECELVTRAMLENAVRQNPTLTLDDLRRDVRLGMGPCQGGFCAYRAAGILHEMSSDEEPALSGAKGRTTKDERQRACPEQSEGTNDKEPALSGAKGRTTKDERRRTNKDEIWDVAYLHSPAHNVTQCVSPAALRNPKSKIRDPQSEIRNPKSEIRNPNLLLRDFLQERWKGLTPILWGAQLKQERLDELIYLCLMNADHLPDAELISPMTEFYAGQTGQVSDTSQVSEAPDA